MTDLTKADTGRALEGRPNFGRATGVDLKRLVRPFEVGERVDYGNHVVGYHVFPLDVVSVTEACVTAESDEGRTFTFHPTTGLATWSSNLSIRHRPNERTEP